MKTILLIGQAPPSQKQEVPFDTTMLYDWLLELNVSKQSAQEMIEFDSVFNRFPGFQGNGHAVPTQEQMDEHWSSLKEKVKKYNKIWIVGKVALDYLKDKEEMKGKIIINTIHPSFRNKSIYLNNKKSILEKIETIL